MRSIYTINIDDMNVDALKIRHLLWRPLIQKSKFSIFSSFGNDQSILVNLQNTLIRTIGSKHSNMLATIVIFHPIPLIWKIYNTLFFSSCCLRLLYETNDEYVKITKRSL